MHVQSWCFAYYIITFCFVDVLVVTLDQALFLFRFENYIPAGKAKFSGSR